MTIAFSHGTLEAVMPKLYIITGKIKMGKYWAFGYRHYINMIICNIFGHNWSKNHDYR